VFDAPHKGRVQPFVRLVAGTLAALSNERPEVLAILFVDIVDRLALEERSDIAVKSTYDVVETSKAASFDVALYIPIGEGIEVVVFVAQFRLARGCIGLLKGLAFSAHLCNGVYALSNLFEQVAGMGPCAICCPW